ncbi:MAG: 4-(cytidine 5'-diphospho)-2-C-methyl-D-erythritol kinase [Catenisphaera adipataccumulans]|jgi:4-diphosphocytidyl-2-C-methyl-D-erythritol kinase|uniref:4-(cytidine 5'-diphospho)-2-C-methyl-D-erythritol kinase n=1 Tax=Catenisphaera adipataccumulans TaxID=700500 RepID=UPI003D91D0F4
MRVYAPGKVNLALDVIGRRPDGYHELDMVMAPISLYNVLDIVPARHTVISCTNGDIPAENTMKKMLCILKERFPALPGFTVIIDEYIPMKAGLAGASANAAAVLRGINQLEHLNLSEAQMIEIGKHVGADVPFCIVNRLARVKGIGEKISVFCPQWTTNALLVKPDVGVSTPEAFRLWHEQAPLHPSVNDVQKAIAENDADLFHRAMGNALEPVAERQLPVITEIKNGMMKAGLHRAMMTGSGSTIMGFGNVEIMKKLKEEWKQKYSFVDIVKIGGDAWPIQL